MLDYRHTALALAWLLAIGTTPATSADGSPVGASEPRLYTNADLERHAGPAGAAPAVAREPGAEAGWQFVADHLAREYRHLEIEREMTIERQRAEAEAGRLEANASEAGAWLPWNLAPACSGPWGRYGPWRPRQPRAGHTPTRGADEGSDRSRPVPSRDRITPLHARSRIAPMPTTRGEDAVPRR